ncbi:MAG: 4'-phosphopantetheinyl transferase superfamily protein [Roseivirga sp.]|nr:4'-phosphopantetheinyl transferase superfamily protein [Roseivirga sp.]
MPVTRVTTLNASVSFALWKIDEPLEELMALYPFSKADTDLLNEQKVESRKMEWLSARLALKTLLDAHGLSPFKIVKDESGKPHLAGSDVGISISHTKNYGAAIINTERPAGIDIEYPRNQIQRIAHKFLHEDEKVWVKEDIEKLTWIWSAKEALYKLHGRTQLTFATQLYIHEPLAHFPKKGAIMENGQRDEFELSYHKHDGLVVCLAF